MSTERILFIGGPEDGKYHLIQKGMDSVCFAQESGPLVDANDLSIKNGPVKAARYVRNGKAMRLV